MTAGQCCVLVASPEGMKQSPVARCLFGPPDPEETRKLLQEDLAMNRERVLRTWGVDILALDLPRTTRPDTPTPYSRQTRISDFWRNKRASRSVKSSSELKTTDRPAASTTGSSNTSSSPELQQPEQR